MAEDTTQDAAAGAQAPKPDDPRAADRAQAREHTDPTERNQPIPLLAALTMAAVLLFGVGYIAFSDAPGAPELGDRRTVADLRTGPVKAAGQADGQQLYTALCVACHQASGKGLAGVFPPLDGSEWVVGDTRVVAHILLHGINGPLTVAGVAYQGLMPPFKQLSDAELAAVASHVRAAWSNKAAPVAPELFAVERKASTARTAPYVGGDELKALAAKPP